MNHQQSYDDFESRLADIEPANCDVSAGAVLFQAGISRGIEIQRHQNRKTMRCWQLATACLFLVSAGAVFLQQRPDPQQDRFARIDPTDKADAVTAIAPTDSGATSRVATSRTFRPAFDSSRNLVAFSLFPTIEKPSLNQRQRMLNRGVEGLPGLTMPTRFQAAQDHGGQQVSGDRFSLLKEFLPKGN